MHFTPAFITLKHRSHTVFKEQEILLKNILQTTVKAGVKLIYHTCDEVFLKPCKLCGYILTGRRKEITVS